MTLEEKYDALSSEELAELNECFRNAVRYRAMQWDEERRIERILDEDIDVDCGGYAVDFDPDTSLRAAEELFPPAVIRDAIIADAARNKSKS